MCIFYRCILFSMFLNTYSMPETQSILKKGHSKPKNDKKMVYFIFSAHFFFQKFAYSKHLPYLCTVFINNCNIIFH